jgi:hypothetical protein
MQFFSKTFRLSFQGLHPALQSLHEVLELDYFGNG